MPSRTGWRGKKVLSSGVATGTLAGGLRFSTPAKRGMPFDIIHAQRVNIFAGGLSFYCTRQDIVNRRWHDEDRWFGTVKCLEWNVYEAKVFFVGVTAG
jgi:hypothetical protein